MTQPDSFNRITLIVLDSLGMGEMPDAADWGDAGSDTLGHILETREVRLPNLQAYGLGNSTAARCPAREARALLTDAAPCARTAKTRRPATGRWRNHFERAFPTYRTAFRAHHYTLRRRGKRPRILGNVLRRNGDYQGTRRRARPHRQAIVYTSADSVFQIAAHEAVIPLPRLYEICETARRILKGEDEVGRVIARPFEGTPGAFRRTENRHDYAVPPPRENLLVALNEAGLDVVCIGKVASIYDAVGVTLDLRAKNNDQSIDQTIKALKDDTRGLIFSNLVDFDMLYGHRRDPEGYARALEHFDSRLPEIEAAMKEGDVFIITADHGNDPTFPGTDHTREYAPLIVYGKRARAGVDLRIRGSLSDIGQTIAENFGLKLLPVESFCQR